MQLLQNLGSLLLYRSLSLPIHRKWWASVDRCRSKSVPRHIQLLYSTVRVERKGRSLGRGRLHRNATLRGGRVTCISHGSEANLTWYHPLWYQQLLFGFQICEGGFSLYCTVHSSQVTSVHVKGTPYRTVSGIGYGIGWKMRGRAWLS